MCRRGASLSNGMPNTPISTRNALLSFIYSRMGFLSSEDASSFYFVPQAECNPVGVPEVYRACHGAAVGWLWDGSLYPSSGRNRRGLLAGLRCRGLRPDHSVGMAFAGSLYLSIRPRAHPPSGFAAGRGGRRLVKSQFSTLLIATHPTRKSRAGGATPCAGRNPSLRSVASALAPQTQVTSRKTPATSGRSGQPPPTGWLRHSAVLVSPRRAADPVPLGTPTGQLIPYQRELFLPRAPGKSCSKAIHAFERFSSLIRGARCRSAPEPGSLYPYKPIPDKSLPYQRKLPSGRAGPACPRWARGSLYPQG